MCSYLWQPMKKWLSNKTKNKNFSNTLDKKVLRNNYLKGWPTGHDRLEIVSTYF